MKLDDLSVAHELGQRLEQVNKAVADLTPMKESEVVSLCIGPENDARRTITRASITVGSLQRALQYQREDLTEALRGFGVEVNL